MERYEKKVCKRTNECNAGIGDGDVNVVGCGSADSKSTEATEQTAEASTDEDIEIWSTNNGYLPVEAGSELYNFYKDIIGVGIVQPYVEWNGGETYLEQLNLRIAAGDMPDMFTPWNGVETELIANGALLDLTDLLLKKHLICGRAFRRISGTQ